MSNTSINDINTSLDSKIDYNQFHINMAASGSWDDYPSLGFYSGSNLTNSPVDGWFNVITIPYNGNVNYSVQIGFNMQHIYLRGKPNSKDWTSWAQVH